MKAVILAAGKGSRLNHPEIPKPLTTLSNGKSILQYQIDALIPWFSLKSIHLVVGYREQDIIDAFPDLSFVHNPHFASENTAKSLLRALKGMDDDVLWLNGDVVFDPEILKPLIISKVSAMIVNVAPVGEEEVKYRADKRNRILEVSKTVSDSQGEALGINLCKKKDLPLFIESLNNCSESDYFEKGIQISIDNGMHVEAIAVRQNQCTEIDFSEDLERANQMIFLWI